MSIPPAANADWRPAVPLSQRIDMAEEDKLAWRTTALAALAEADGIVDPPGTALKRWLTLDEAPWVWANCLNEQGFPATVTLDGAVDTSMIGPTQQRALAVAFYICQASYTIDPRFHQPPTDEQRRIDYEYLVDFWIPCVEARGFSISDPPSKASYVATPVNSPNAWAPILEIQAANLPEAEWMALQVACPYSAPLAAMYGE